MAPNGGRVATDSESRMCKSWWIITCIQLFANWKLSFVIKVALIRKTITPYKRQLGDEWQRTNAAYIRHRQKGRSNYTWVHHPGGISPKVGIISLLSEWHFQFNFQQLRREQKAGGWGRGGGYVNLLAIDLSGWCCYIMVDPGTPAP